MLCHLSSTGAPSLVVSSLSDEFFPLLLCLCLQCSAFPSVLYQRTSSPTTFVTMSIGFNPLLLSISMWEFITIGCFKEIFHLWFCYIPWLLGSLYFLLLTMPLKCRRIKAFVKGSSSRTRNGKRDENLPLLIHLSNLLVSLGLLQKHPLMGFLSMISWQSSIETCTQGLSSQVSCSWKIDSSGIFQRHPNFSIICITRLTSSCRLHWDYLCSYRPYVLFKYNWTWPRWVLSQVKSLWNSC